MSSNMNNLHEYQITDQIVRNAWQVAVGRLTCGLAFVIIGMALFFSIFQQPLTLRVVGEALLGLLLQKTISSFQKLLLYHISITC
jgi:hypothetical protein